VFMLLLLPHSMHRMQRFSRHWVFTWRQPWQRSWGRNPNSDCRQNIVSLLGMAFPRAAEMETNI
jgi:hypothetical protein